MSTTDREQKLQYIVAFTLLLLALARTIGPDWQSRMDAVFFSAVGVIVVLFLIPLSSLKSFKAGSIEVSLGRPEIDAAIGGLQLTHVQNKELRTALETSKDILSSIRGSRVLWIDDRPDKIVALRRVLRSLGVDVECALSSTQAKDKLAVDADYDLLISDVQREGDTYKITGGVDIHEGTNFVVWLRSKHQDPVVRNLPVAFYAAYDWERLVEFTEPARQTLPEPTISNSVPDFMDKVIRQLAKSRSMPLVAGGSKEAT